MFYDMKIITKIVFTILFDHAWVCPFVECLLFPLTDFKTLKLRFILPVVWLQASVLMRLASSSSARPFSKGLFPVEQ